MRTKSILLAGNWKMNHGPADTAKFLEAIEVKEKPNAKMRLYVPYLSLQAALESVENRLLPIEIGAQNVHFEKSGAFTGEISAPMLKEVGITQALIGHSERRQYFNETNDTVLKRTVFALSQGMEVLLCIGETLAERQANRTEAVLEEQLVQILAQPDCLSAFGTKLHIAYEPVWAIGTGVVATPEQAEAAHAFIRGLLAKKLPSDQVNATRILYGGSVSPSNFAELLKCPNIDGGLVGGASLKLDSWTQLWGLL
ncbi:MAG: triose-phosphate isomerase [Bdellovibrionales bacterium]|nr:triose-phosphate isomerase [Bdellovibrionales bacterium]